MAQASAAPAAAVAPLTSTLESVTADVARETTPKEAPAVEVETNSDAPKLKRKVNGKMVEVTEDELWKHYGLETTAKQRMEKVSKQAEEAKAKHLEAEAKIKQVEGLFEKMKANPRAAFELLQNLGHDGRQIARQMVLEELEYERMNADQKRAHDFEQENKRLKDIQDNDKKAKEQSRQVQINQYFENQIDTNIADALKVSGMQPTKELVVRMARACETLIKGLPPGRVPEPKQIADKALALLRQDVGGLLELGDIKKLRELGIISDNSLKRLVRQYQEDSKKDLPSFGTGSKRSSTPSGKSDKSKKIGVNEFFNQLDEKFK